MRGLSAEWASRAELPSHVVTLLNNLPSNVHPMTQFASAIAALNSESKFAKAYEQVLTSNNPPKAQVLICLLGRAQEQVLGGHLRGQHGLGCKAACRCCHHLQQPVQVGRIILLPISNNYLLLSFFREGAVPCPPDPAKDWSANFCEMIGYKDPLFTELMRLYLTIHRLAIE